MDETLAAKFIRSKGFPVEWEGKKVNPIYIVKVKEKGVFIIERNRNRVDLVQGIRITIDKGNLKVNGQTLKDLILWTDTSPDTISINYNPKGDATIKIWNIWKYDTQIFAWIGNAGLLIDDNNDDAVTIRCSAGINSVPNFDDMIFCIRCVK